MKVIVTGSNGQLGRALLNLKPDGIEVIPTDRNNFNLLDLKVCPVDDISITTSAASFLIKPSVAPWLSINLKSVIPNSFKYFLAKL